MDVCNAVRTLARENMTTVHARSGVKGVQEPPSQYNEGTQRSIQDMLVT
jgi:hypothetical protein